MHGSIDPRQRQPGRGHAAVWHVICHERTDSTAPLYTSRTSGDESLDEYTSNTATLANGGSAVG